MRAGRSGRSTLRPQRLRIAVVATDDEDEEEEEEEEEAAAAEAAGSVAEILQQTAVVAEAATERGAAAEEGGDLASEYQAKVVALQEEMSSNPGAAGRKDLQDKPLTTLGIVLGATVLFLGLGRLPALFWLIGTASLAEDAFREELFDVLLLKKPFAEASPQLGSQVMEGATFLFLSLSLSRPPFL